MTEVHELNRYSRQELIEGWDQHKLTKATVAVIGAGYLGQEVAIPLAALGIGNLRIIGTEADTGIFGAPTNNTSTKALEDVLGQVNKDINVRGIEGRLVNAAGSYLLHGVDCIIDTTNDPRSKAIAHAYGKKNDIPVISASSMPNYGTILFNGEGMSALLPQFEGKVQDPFVAAVLGGLVAEEVKRIYMKGELLEHQLHYSPLNPDRFSPSDGKELPYEFRNASVLMIGAGALGNFAGKALAMMKPRRIDIMDPDDIEPTNLNRQVLYYDSVGQPKSLALAHKLTAISGKTRVSGIVERFEADTALSTKYDLIMECTDSDRARQAINDYAVSNKIPLISGGTDYQGGRAIVYVPSKTSCLCQVDISGKAKAEEVRMSQSCIYAPNPSVIMTNQVIGSLMANEARTIFSDVYGNPFNGVLKLTNHEYRVGVNPITKVCKHES